MPTLRKMYVNDIDLSTFGLWVNPPDGWVDAPRIEDNILSIPGLAGGLLYAREATTHVRELSIDGTLIANTALDARDQWDAIKKLLAGDALEIRFDLWPDRYGVGRYQSIEWVNVRGIEQGATFRMTFLLPNPFLLGLTMDAYVLPLNSEVSLNLGTAPSFVSFMMIGVGASAPTITYRDVQGNLRGIMTYNLTGPLAVGDWIEFDGAGFVATLHQTNNTIISNASPFMASESVLFTADPADTEAILGSLNCEIVAYVRKAYR